MKSEETEFFIDNSKSRATRSEDNKTIFSPDFSQSSNFTGFFSNSRVVGWTLDFSPENTDVLYVKLHILIYHEYTDRDSIFIIFVPLAYI